jgi:hypothetical protein
MVGSWGVEVLPVGTRNGSKLIAEQRCKEGVGRYMVSSPARDVGTVVAKSHEGVKGKVCIAEAVGLVRQSNTGVLRSMECFTEVKSCEEVRGEIMGIIVPTRD